MNIDILAFTGSFRSQSELFVHQQPSLRIEKVGGASFKYGFMTEKCTELRSQPGDGKLPSKVTARCSIVTQLDLAAPVSGVDGRF